MSFATTATVTGLAALLLAIGWLFAGQLMIRRWGREPNEIALVIGRRIGGVYLSIALMFAYVRTTTVPEMIFTFSAFGMVANLILAFLGLSEFLQHRVGRAMLVSVALEIFLALAFARLTFA